MTPPSSRRFSRRQVELLALAGILVLSFVLRTRFLSVPFERDEGEYAYIAWIMNEGDAPYREAFNQKPPGIFLAYLLAMRIFGFTIEGVHLGMTLWTLATIACVWAIGRRLLSERAGLVAAAIFSIASISPAVSGSAANTEIFMVLPLAAGALVASGIARGGATARSTLACGLLAGAAITFKQVAASDGAFFAGVIAMVTLARGGRTKALAQNAAAFLSGLLLPWLPLAGYLLFKGAFDEFVRDAILLNASYSSLVPLGEYPASFWEAVTGVLAPTIWPYLVLAPLGLATLVFSNAKAGETRWFLPAWFAFSLLGTSTGGMFRDHYFIQVLAPLSLLASHALVTVTGRLSGAPLRLAVQTAAVVSPLVLGMRPYLLATPFEVSRKLYSPNPFVESLEVAEVVRINSAPSDRVLIFGSEPQILFYARRRSASRYILTYPLMMDVEGAHDRQVEMYGDLQRTRPRLIVFVNKRLSHLWGPWTSRFLVENLKEVVQRDYERIFPTARSGDSRETLAVFRLKEGTASSRGS